MECEKDQNYEQARLYYGYAIDRYARSGNKHKVNELRLKVARVYEQEANQYEKSKDPSSASVYYRNAANAYKEIGNTDKADEMRLKAATSYEQHSKENQAANMAKHLIHTLN